MSAEILNNVPDGLWVVAGALIGGLITFLSLIIQNKFEHERFLKQLEHETETRAKDKEINTKLKVYFDALESLSEAVSTILKIADTSELNELASTNMSGRFQKVQIAAEPQTLRTFNQSSSILAEAYVKLLPHKLQLQELETNLNSLQETQNMFLNASKENTSEMEEFNKKGDWKNQYWGVLKERAEYYQQEMDKIQAEKEPLPLKILEKRLEIIRLAYEYYKKASPNITAFIIEVKKEILPATDNSTYDLLTEMHTKSNAHQEKLLSELLDQLNQLAQEER